MSESGIPPRVEPAPMSEEDPEIPWGQRFFDRPFFLLILGLVIMIIFYSGWGLWEVSRLGPAPLP